LEGKTTSFYCLFNKKVIENLWFKSQRGKEMDRWGLPSILTPDNPQ